MFRDFVKVCRSLELLVIIYLTLQRQVYNHQRNWRSNPGLFGSPEPVTM